MSNEGLPSSGIENVVFGDYALSESSFTDKRSSTGNYYDLQEYNKSLTALSGYIIPIEDVRSSIFMAENEIEKTISALNSFLSNVNINPYHHHDLMQAHVRLCEEAGKYLDTSKSFPPSFICFEEFVFAERFQSSASRMLIAKYMNAVGHTSYGHLFYFRKIAQLIQNEVRNMKNVVMTIFGGQYADEFEQKIGLQFDSWAKSALHYTQRITAIIYSEPQGIDSAELGEITQENAAKFQTFFAVKLNSVNNRIDNLLENLHKDLRDNSRIFYNKYLKPSLRLNKEVADSLELEFDTTFFVERFPQLSRELVEATNILKLNFYSTYTDLFERLENVKQELDACFEMIHEKRKYSNYISQLSSKTFKKQNVLSEQKDEDYNILFRSLYVDEHRNDTYQSPHSLLDGLENDDHPQYLLRDGGSIVGDIDIENDAKIGGIHLPTHAHTGTDGSARIRSTDIDYNTARTTKESLQFFAPKPLSLSVEDFRTKIVDGGQPVTDAILSIVINTDDEIMPDEIGVNDFELEFFYTEVETFE